MEIITRAGCKAISLSGDEKLHTLRDVLDLIPAAWQEDCPAVIVPKDCLPEAFFDLKTGFAGETLQKFTNYNIKIAVTGDFDGYTSRSLRDFMYESNKGRQVFFKATAEEALAAIEKALV